MNNQQKMRAKDKILLPSLHPRNKHRGRYDFNLLKIKNPYLVSHIKLNEFTKDETIDFSDPRAVKELNFALLKHYYNLSYWDIPEGFLCPPIPGRADYIHHMRDLVGSKKDVIGLDIGVGANCIYPILGYYEYQWKFVGAELDETAFQSANKIVTENVLQEFIQIRKQDDKKSIFKGIIKIGDSFDFSICNPPFHASKKEAELASAKKSYNLKTKKQLNFGGKSNELWCDGGESDFIRRMVLESCDFKNQVKWFSTLVSKKENLSGLYGELKRIGVTNIKTIQMGQGQKTSRFVAWSFG